MKMTIVGTFALIWGLKWNTICIYQKTQEKTSNCEGSRNIFPTLLSANISDDISIAIRSRSIRRMFYTRRLWAQNKLRTFVIMAKLGMAFFRILKSNKFAYDPIQTHNKPTNHMHEWRNISASSHFSLIWVVCDSVVISHTRDRAKRTQIHISLDSTLAIAMSNVRTLATRRPENPSRCFVFRRN